MINNYFVEGKRCRIDYVIAMGIRDTPVHPSASSLPFICCCNTTTVRTRVAGAVMTAVVDVVV